MQGLSTTATEQDHHDRSIFFRSGAFDLIQHRPAYGLFRREHFVRQFVDRKPGEKVAVTSVVGKPNVSIHVATLDIHFKGG
jgi:hypothetical protein